MYTSSSDECGKGDGVTSTGVLAREGRTIAADDIPAGTKVVIGGRVYVVEDCFGGDKRNCIDVYTESLPLAIEFGRKTMNVQIINEKRMIV